MGTVATMTDYRTVNPATGETVKEFDTLDGQGVEQALSRAAAGFEQWRATSPAERAAVLSSVAKLYGTGPRSSRS